MKLTADNVMKTLKNCIHDSNSSKAGDEIIMVDGIAHKFEFKKEKLEKCKDDIVDMLGQLPPQFKQGWSFLMACDDKEGEQWGEHKHMEALVCLGIAIGKVSMLPRELWPMLPGGMPYFTVLT
jgi:hypothetical protein